MIKSLPVMGALLALAFPAGAVEPSGEGEHADTLPLTAIDTSEHPSLPFDVANNVMRVGLYQAVPINELIRSGMIGSKQDLKMYFKRDAVRIEVPNHRIRYHTILGYDPRVDSVRPYQTEFSPKIEYQLVDGAFEARGEPLGQCGDVEAIFAAGSYLYLDMPNDGEGVRCAIESLLMGYGIFAFHQEDRPEMYEILPLNNADTINDGDVLEYRYGL